VTRWAWIALAACALGAVVTVLLTVPFPVLPGAHPHVDVSRDFTAAQLARERAFHSAGRWTTYASLGASLVIALALGATRLGGRLVGGIPGHWTVKALVGTALMIALGRLAALPFDVQQERVLRRYGLSTQDWASWTDDQLRGLGIAVATTGLVVLAVLALARRFPTTWWISGGLLAASFTLVASFAYPVVIEPAFNSFTPLQAGTLRTDLLALAAKDHVPVEDVLVADASKRTTSLNAYVSGFGSTRRIVLYDTLITSTPPKEVELIVAHELGHAKRQDVLHGTIIGAFGSGIAITGLWLLLGWTGLLSRIGATSAGDPRVVPFVLMLAVVVPLLLSPLTNLVSRHIEARADMHSLDLTGDLDTYIASEQRLSTVNLSDLDPGPVAYQLFFTHPSGPQRIALAREWKRLHP
jgi:STE24 endopeptidase